MYSTAVKQVRLRCRKKKERKKKKKINRFCSGPTLFFISFSRFLNLPFHYVFHPLLPVFVYAARIYYFIFYVDYFSTFFFDRVVFFPHFRFVHPTWSRTSFLPFCIYFLFSIFFFGRFRSVFRHAADTSPFSAFNPSPSLMLFPSLQVRTFHPSIHLQLPLPVNFLPKKTTTFFPSRSQYSLHIAYSPVYSQIPVSVTFVLLFSLPRDESHQAQ